MQWQKIKLFLSSKNKRLSKKSRLFKNKNIVCAKGEFIKSSDNTTIKYLQKSILLT